MTDAHKGPAQLSSDASNSPNTLNALIIDALRHGQVRSSSLAGGAAVIEIAGREESEARSHASLEVLAAHP
ncbi:MULTISPECIES: hypothetical protein [Rhodococcus]|uniref:hypothetical protein n=1 Tax=Rhodococcus TaxID=1827 RepID=UPI00071DC351|nr:MULTISPECIES: hypothetical protein [Rhodococcus]ANQ75563.1 hypothetical protein AOT96_31545 [Rhodococcus sp. 008]KSU70549.1 hypothetical protein AS032_26730 [Rhodococcus qingshengii]SCC63791.1 hypothetical protein GA0061093_1178 [Rhodococcus qingshengii]